MTGPENCVWPIRKNETNRGWKHRIEEEEPMTSRTESLRRESPLSRPRSTGTRMWWGAVLGLAMGVALVPQLAQSQAVAQTEDVIDLTLERMVQLTIQNSYQVQFLDMGIQQRTLGLQAERARLRSSVSLDFTAPTFRSVSENQYNSVLGRNEVVRENSRRWEAQLSVRQPVIIPWLGYPTNGYLSLNNRVYRYTQVDEDGSQDLTYYNRYFVRYTQPLFQPNGLKNSLEQAELNLEESAIDYTSDMVGIVDNVGDDYYDLFETAYEEVIRAQYVANLERAAAAAQALAANDPSRAIELNQINVELANAREDVQRSVSDFRLRTAELRTRLNLSEDVELMLTPIIELTPITIDVERATQYALELTPRMRELDIQHRVNEIRLDEQRGRGGFRVNLELTYGREMRDEALNQLWREPSNTYTIDVNAYVPIWDWGERDARIESQEINLRRTQLQMEQSRISIVSNVQNEIRNVEELQARTLTMEENLSLATSISEESLERYESGSSTVVDLLQSFRREADTAENFLDAYLGWRESLQRIQRQTYWDFETDQPVLDRYGITISAL